jgi:hypothetical protein
MLGPVFHGLLRQKARAEAIELYIPRSYRRFPEWGGGLPDVPEGVTIVRVDEDLGPATKILPAARARRGQDIDLIYVDDDRVYGPGWTAAALRLRKRHPRAAVCGSGFSIEQRYGYSVPDARQPAMVRSADVFWTFAHQFVRIGATIQRIFSRTRSKPKPRLVARSGYAEIAEGYGGVMVRPDYFGDEAWVIPPGLWAVDDIWLSGMMARRNVPVWVDRSLFDVSANTGAGSAAPLFYSVIDGLDRDQANRACIDHMRTTYGIWGGSATQSA